MQAISSTAVGSAVAFAEDRETMNEQQQQHREQEQQWQERVAVVTGAASGIGRATAEQLLEAGARVVGVDLTDDGLAWLAGRERAAAVAGDISTEACNTAMVKCATSTFGALHTLILNAGVAPFGPLEQITPDQLERTLAVNVRGVLLGLQAALPALREAEAPSVVVTSSISGIAGDPFMSIYGASKAAASNLVRAAAVELGAQGIRVNAVCPGATRTTMTKPLLDSKTESIEQFRRRIPLKRFAEPHEVAAVIVFLASPAASFVTGAAVPVDGGVTANVGQWAAPD
jgi:meso-butanediol dehydrogenase/(S,S)-butanediol dehydrogenase/diacetyl reductase